MIVSSLVMADVLVDRKDMIELVITMDDDQIKDARAILRNAHKVAYEKEID